MSSPRPKDPDYSILDDLAAGKTPAQRADDDSVPRVLDDEFKKLGYPAAARLSIIGDVGRENSWDRNIIFGGHKDPKNAEVNRGIISWQKDRRHKLNEYLENEGLLGKADDDELRGMARFMDRELQESYKNQHARLKTTKSTAEASKALHRYIAYSMEPKYNTPDKDFHSRNNRDWAEKARKLGIAADNDDQPAAVKTDFSALDRLAEETDFSALDRLADSPGGPMAKDILSPYIKPGSNATFAGDGPQQAARQAQSTKTGPGGAVRENGAVTAVSQAYTRRQKTPGELYYKFEDTNELEDGSSYLGTLNGKFRFRDPHGDEFEVADPSKGEKRYLGPRKKISDAEGNEYTRAENPYSRMKGWTRYTREIDGRPINFLYRNGQIREEVPKAERRRIWQEKNVPTAPNAASAITNAPTANPRTAIPEEASNEVDLDPNEVIGEIRYSPLPEGVDPVESAKNDVATGLKEQYGIPFEVGRQWVDQYGIGTSPKDGKVRNLSPEEIEAAVKKNERFFVTSGNLDELLAQVDPYNERKALIDAKEKEYRSQGNDKFESQLMALRDLGVKDYKGKPIEDAIAEEQQAKKEWEDDTGFFGLVSNMTWNKLNNTTSFHPDPSMGGRAPVGVSREDVAAYNDTDKARDFEAQKAEIIARHGSFTEYRRYNEKINKQYAGKPQLAIFHAAEAAAGGAMKAPLQGVASSLKSISIAAEAIDRALGDESADATKMGFYSLGQDLEEITKEYLKVNPAFEGGQAELFGNVLGQVGTQIVLGVATGGAATPALFGGGMGMAEQYENASNAGAEGWSRVGAAFTGGVLAASDYVIFKGWFKGASAVEKVGFLRKFRDTIKAGLVSKGLVRAEAEAAAKQAADSFAGSLYRYTTEGGKEAFQESIIESKGNDLYAYATYDHTPERLERIFSYTDNNLTEGAAGFVGGIFGAKIGDLASRAQDLSDDDLYSVAANISEIPDLPEEASGVVTKEFERRGLSLATVNFKPDVQSDGFDATLGDGRRVRVLDDRGKLLKVEDDRGRVTLQPERKFADLEQFRSNAKNEPTTEPVQSKAQTRALADSPQDSAEFVHERPVTLQAQAEAMMDAEKPEAIGLLYTNPTDADVPKGSSRFVLPDGVLVVNNEKFRSKYGAHPFRKKTEIESGAIPHEELIGGKAVPDRDTTQGTAVVTVDAEGNELNSSKISDKPVEQWTPEEKALAAKQVELDKQRFGDKAVSSGIADTEEIIASRQEDRPIGTKALYVGPNVAEASATDAAYDAATSPTNELPEPTRAMKEAGNYKLGHVKINGLDLSIENPVGSERSGTDPDGKPWKVVLKNHYGYLKRSTGADQENIDVFVRDQTPADFSGQVYVVDQVDPKTGDFDEHKALIGFENEAEAREAYLSNYEKDWKGLAAITAMPFDEFKRWAKEGEQIGPVNLLSNKEGQQTSASDIEPAEKSGLPSNKAEARATKEGFLVSQGKIEPTGVAKLRELRDVERRKAETDPLTGVANRRALDRALPSAEADPQTSVIAFDANNFGQINKKVGEDEGDKILKLYANALEASAKESPGSRVFRKGGDEFTVLAPVAQADAVRKRAEEDFGEHKYDGFTVSISGVVGDTFADADAQLQNAKKERKKAQDSKPFQTPDMIRPKGEKQRGLRFVPIGEAAMQMARVPDAKSALEKAVSDFAADAVQNPKNEKVSISLGVASDANADAVMIATGLDIAGYERVIDNYSVKHIINEHGSDATEDPRGQEAVTPEDFALIPEIVENPDTIEAGGKTRVGRETIRYIKRFNGEIFFVEEARTGKKQLVPDTLYKRKAPVPPKLSTPEATLLSEQQRVSAETDAVNDDTTGTEQTDPPSTRAREAGIEAALDVAEGSDLRELIQRADPKDLIRDGYRLETASLEIYELARRSVEETELAKGNQKPQRFDAIYLNPDQTSDVTKALRSAAREAVNAGLTVTNAAKLETMAQTIDEAAAGGDGSAILYLFDDALPHEEWHKAGYGQAVDKRLAERHSKENLKSLADSGVVKKLRDGAFRSLYPDASDAVTVEEAAAWIVGGGREKLNSMNRSRGVEEISEEEAIDFVIAWVRSYRDKNPNANLDEFSKINHYAERILEQAQRTVNREQDASPTRSSESDGGDNRPRRIEGEGPRNAPIERSEATEPDETVGKQPDSQSTDNDGNVAHRRRAAFSRILGQDITYEPRSHRQTEEDAIELEGRFGTEAIINEIFTSAEPSAAKMRVVYRELERLDAHASNLLDEGKSSEYDTVIREIANLAAGITQRQIENGRETEIAKTLEPLSPEAAVLTATRLKQIAKDDPVFTLSVEQTSAVREAAQAKKDTLKLLVKAENEIARLEAVIADLTQSRLPRPKRTQSQRSLYEELVAKRAEIVDRLKRSFETGQAENPALSMARPAETPVDDATRQDLQDYAALMVLDGRSYAEVLNGLDEVSNRTLDIDTIKRIHADAVNLIRPDRRTISPEARERVSIRNEHYKEAEKYETSLDPKRLMTPAARRVVEDPAHAENDKLVTAVKLLTARSGRSINSVIGGITKEHGLSPNEAMSVAREADVLLKQARAEIETEKAEAKGLLAEERQTLKQARLEKGRATHRLNFLLRTMSSNPNMMQRFNSSFRAKLVFNWGTQAWNAIQAVTVATPQEIFQDIAETTFRRAKRRLGKADPEADLKPEVRYRDALLPYWYLKGNQKQVAEEILTEYPEQYFRVFNWLIADVNSETQKLASEQTNVISKAGHTIFDVDEKLNRVLSKISLAEVQETHVRVALFTAKIDQTLRARGSSLKAALADGTLSKQVKEADTRAAVDQALRVTYAELMDKTRVERTIKRAYDQFDRFLPVVLNPVVYARFTFTVTKAVANAHLMGLLDAKAVGGQGYNERSAAKGLFGLTMIGMAYALMNAYGGEDDKWNTLYFEGPDKPPVDIRRVFPISAFFYTAHLIRNKIEGRPVVGGKDGLGAMKNLIEGYASLDLDYYGKSAGVEFVKSLIEYLGATNLDATENLTKDSGRFAGNTIASLARFFKPIRDVYAQINEDEAKLREYDDTFHDKFVQEIARTVPIGALYGAEVQKNPVTGEDLVQPFPAGRLIGINQIHPMFTIRRPTVAEEWAKHYFPNNFTGSMDEDELKAFRIRKELKEAVRIGQITSAEIEPKIDQFVAEGKLTSRSAEILKGEADLTALQEIIKRNFTAGNADDEKALKIIETLMSDKEKQDVKGILASKRESKAVETEKTKFETLKSDVRSGRLPAAEADKKLLESFEKGDLGGDQLKSRLKSLRMSAAEEEIANLDASTESDTRKIETVLVRLNAEERAKVLPRLVEKATAKRDQAEKGDRRAGIVARRLAAIINRYSQ